MMLNAPFTETLNTEIIFTLETGKLVTTSLLNNKRKKTLRTFLGNMASPHTCWLLLRSLETLKIRMEKQATNAEDVAKFLVSHEAVEKVLFLGFLEKSSDSYRIFKEQYTSFGAMISFYIKGSEKDAFRFLNKLKLIKLAVSLGSTESLAEHPATMTHAGVDPKVKNETGITENLIRISIGVENSQDIINDITQALEELDV